MTVGGWRPPKSTRYLWRHPAAQDFLQNRHLSSFFFPLEVRFCLILIERFASYLGCFFPAARRLARECSDGYLVLFSAGDTAGFALDAFSFHGVARLGYDRDDVCRL